MSDFAERLYSAQAQNRSAVAWNVRIAQDAAEAEQYHRQVLGPQRARIANTLAWALWDDDAEQYDEPAVPFDHDLQNTRVHLPSGGNDHKVWNLSEVGDGFSSTDGHSYESYSRNFNLIALTSGGVVFCRASIEVPRRSRSDYSPLPYELDMHHGSFRICQPEELDDQVDGLMLRLAAQHDINPELFE
ncbi:MAG TPA: hypothetical protein VLF59_00470 [Candidatus Saccharimonadales bacterium]|nr:hypothetical protein [Candidatus Saccharimonadales bacterium]